MKPSVLRVVRFERGGAVSGEAERGRVAVARSVAAKSWVELEANMRFGNRNPFRSTKTIVKQAMMVINIAQVSTFWIPD